MQVPYVSTPHASARVPAPRRSSPSEDVWEALRADDLEEKMGQGVAHADATTLFADVMKTLVAEQQRTARVAWDLFVEWDPNDPRARVSPDVLLLDGQPADIEPSIWQTWKPGCNPPRMALEIVSDRSREKDYDVSPLKYSALGVEELAVFDPGLDEGSSSSADRFALQVFRRSERGQFLRVYAGAGPAESVVLGAWLVVTDGGERVRLARDAEGRDIVPTSQERNVTLEAKVRQLEEEIARLRARG
jgi:Uma2 family endonuclease